ncbi:ExeM/NucH family extracellular endonuclease [Subtercola boreus]|uniref:ExeM/NucH family extracellular endonuclease n=1 Tax=Subtercola boreus TaxID=120213 RepID=UPI001559D2B0|nr:ExeM/NucH family extracellular endonuclease [Subtercola boreus]
MPHDPYQKRPSGLHLVLCSKVAVTTVALVALTAVALVAPAPPAEAASVSIATIQGTSASSPLVGSSVTTTGFVTAAYATGGLNGYFLQSAGTGGAIDPRTHRASDGLFVYLAGTPLSARIGDYLQVSGLVSEFGGLTQLSPPTAGSIVPLDPTGVAAPLPAATKYPGTDSDRESLEGMLIQPAGDFTVTGLQSAAQYGQIELAAGTVPLAAPTSVGAVGSAEYAATASNNRARAVWLDDGATTSFTSASGSAKPLPYLSGPARVGAPVTFTRPVVLDYRNSAWRFQPTTEVTGTNEATTSPARFGATRTAAPTDVGGSIRLGTFNVLNFFPTTGDERSGCTYFSDRAGSPVTVNNSDAPGCGVRGAATRAHFLQQQSKIVSAILALGADIVSLEEIENSAKLGMPRDHALGVLVDALNAADRPADWRFVPSPAAVPALADEDVIRTGFIYRSSVAEPVGPTSILVGSAPFDNAREPDAQAFRPVYATGAETFLVVSNHFKSKSGPDATGDNVDTGQGAFNGDRTRQALALLDFAKTVSRASGTDRVFLVGDFNALSHEDPVLAIVAAGFADLGAGTGKASYSFSGESGSIDHIFASVEAKALVTGTDIWNINSVEAPVRQYSAANANVSTFVNPKDPFRSSDHDPLVVGLALPQHTPPTIPNPPTGESR